MFNSGILDVTLALIFIYLLLSFTCSAISEFLEARLKMRASDLERGLRELLNDPTGTGLVQQVYSHPLVFGLFRGKYDPAKITDGQYQRGSQLPSYIPAQIFTLALMDIVMPAGATSAAVSGAAGATVARAGSAPASTGVDGATVAAAPLQPLRDSIAKMQNADVRSALLVLVDAAGDDISKARANIENWFDSSMDRVSGWYKRRVQSMVLALGLGIAIIVNADTITIANSLSHDVAMRDSLVAAAQEYARVSNTLGQTAPNPTSDVEACKKDENSPECRVERNLNQIRKLGLPVGWNRDDPRTFPQRWEGWLMKFFGWILTAMAVSLGAPFWFDMLNKVMVIRATVKPKEKSPDEPPVDRP